eukprot:SAG11_NODE_785_length_7173_cov_4.452926_3_plen_219_part_00
MRNCTISSRSSAVKWEAIDYGGCDHGELANFLLGEADVLMRYDTLPPKLCTAHVIPGCFIEQKVSRSGTRAAASASSFGMGRADSATSRCTPSRPDRGGVDALSLSLPPALSHCFSRSLSLSLPLPLSPSLSGRVRVLPGRPQVRRARISTLYPTGTNWWGSGEPIWLTDVPSARAEGRAGALGAIANVTFEDVEAEGENGVLVRRPGLEHPLSARTR